MKVSKQEFDAWRNSVVGREFFQELKDFSDASALQIGQGGTLRPTAEETALVTANQTGFVTGIDAIIAHDPFIGTRREDKGDRTTPPH